ncbi:MAG: 2-hydroxyglutaryl-CoA dehydratase [Deltaproteobacteria bacterium]|nr:2-hydroxyglutaryl-CoA dehydratase [Deltaproteobacteria bacterium]
MKHYLGIDVGSVSVKLALLKGDELVGKAYLKNQGLISTVQEGLRQLPRVKICGVGVTGSGKDFVKALVGADYTDSEIISHITATLKQYPEVRTVLDIGGEDSQMNRSCGGGTGSMIETIASRLGISIEEAGDVALRSKDPAVLPGKCGIFAQSAAVSELSKGRPAEDILMGVSKALVGNYLATLAKGKKLREPVVFQGATAQNKALVRCFEDILGVPVIVPRDCSYMGAIGIALLAEENMDGKTKFRGGAILSKNYHTEVGHCDDPCENNCELLRLFEGDKLLAVFGSRCEKYN